MCHYTQIVVINSNAIIIMNIIIIEGDAWRCELDPVCCYSTRVEFVYVILLSVPFLGCDY
jgi:hypothetical protein